MERGILAPMKKGNNGDGFKSNGYSGVGKSGVGIPVKALREATHLLNVVLSAPLSSL